MAEKTLLVKEVFHIPDWYLLTEKEEDKLFRYIFEARDENEARLARFMDCTAICDEQYCFFCSLYCGDIQRPCTPCHRFVARE